MTVTSLSQSLSFEMSTSKLIPPPVSIPAIQGAKRARDAVQPLFSQARPIVHTPTPLTPTKVKTIAENETVSTPEPKKRRTFSAGSPGSPLLTPEALAKFGNIGSPHWTHQARQFDKTFPRNSAAKMALKKAVQAFDQKPVHTLDLESPVKSSAIKTKPDKEGRLKHKSKYYRLHNKPDAARPNKLIPEMGPNLVRVTGLQAKALITKYQQDPTQDSFAAFLTRECPALLAQSPLGSKKQDLRTTGLDFVGP